MRHALQQMLAGMPEQRPELVLCGGDDGQVVVTGDRKTVLFGPYHPDDVGMRNIGVVTLTQVGFPVKEVAEAFDLRPGTVSGLRTAFRRGGAAALVNKSGRRAVLTEDKVAEAHALSQAGWTQKQLAARYGVTQSAVSYALRRHRSAHAQAATTTQPELEIDADDAEQAHGEAGGEDEAHANDAYGDTTADAAEDEGAAEAARAVCGQAHSQEAGPGPAPVTGEPPAAEPGGDARTPSAGTAAPVHAPRIGSGEYSTRYAGVMLAYA